MTPPRTPLSGVTSILVERGTRARVIQGSVALHRIAGSREELLLWRKGVLHWFTRPVGSCGWSELPHRWCPGCRASVRPGQARCKQCSIPLLVRLLPPRVALPVTVVDAHGVRGEERVLEVNRPPVGDGYLRGLLVGHDGRRPARGHIWRADQRWYFRPERGAPLASPA